MISNTFNQLVADIASKKQLEYYTLYCKGNSMRQVAKQLGCQHSTVSESLQSLEKKATKSGLFPAYSQDFGAGVGRHVAKVTTHIKDGETVQEWVRTDSDAENAFALIEEAVKELSEEVKGLSMPVKLNKPCNKDLVSVYPLFDKHYGMLSWSQETGVDYDISIAKKQETEVFTRLVESQPSSEEGLVVFGGDYYHCDDDQQVTPAHRNKVDVDGRSSKVFRAGIDMARKYIALALSKHKRVSVEVLPGNHDPVLSTALLHLLSVYYENNKRVTVKDNFSPFSYYEFGKTLIGFQHGDRMKQERMYQVVTTDMREAWGRIKFCHIFTGHFHRERKIDIGMCTLESLRTSIPNEAYAHAAGYRSPRTAYAITFSNEKGEVGRTTHNIV